MKSYVITPSAGKRLIGHGMARHPRVLLAIRRGTLVIVAGTTNGYVAEEILRALGQGSQFSRRGFYRGLTLPSGAETARGDLHSGEEDFTGDVVIVDGQWKKGLTIYDVASDLGPGDLILKGANALDLCRRQAAVLIGHPLSGTVGQALQAAVGRRTGLIIPVGLEKRVEGDLYQIALRLNSPECTGPRLLPIPGEVFTELEALELLTGATGQLVASGGVFGAEGAAWISVGGTVQACQAAEELLSIIVGEPPFSMSLEP